MSRAKPKKNPAFNRSSDRRRKNPDGSFVASKQTSRYQGRNADYMVRRYGGN